MRPLVWTQIAALALISAFLASPVLAQTPPTEALPPAEQVTLPPVPSYPPPAPPTPNVLTNVIWIEQPEARDFARYYPARAEAADMSGSATLDCLVSATGSLSCTVVSEEPAGFGFGEASLRISQHFRAGPTTRDGVATAEGRVRRVIRWRLFG